METIQRFAVPLAILVAGAFIALAVYLSGLSTPGQEATPPSVDIKNVEIAAHDPFIGRADAPVTLAYWSDYQCPFCKAVEVGGVEGINIEPSIPMLIRDYVDTGKLRIVFKDYPFLGEDSLIAALYEHAIWETAPDKFYAWREEMYKAQDDEGDQGFGDEASIITLIKGIPGLDAEALKALVAEKKAEYTKLIQDDASEGSSMGITGTPGFITGKQLISGAEQPAAFKAAIDAQLK